MADELTTSSFRALMHPSRLAILDLLRQGKQCVCHLEAHLGKRQAYISQQLMVLRDAGLVEDERQGLNVYYRVVDTRVFEVVDMVRAMCGEEVHRPVSTEVACPCPQCNAVVETNLPD